MKICFWQSMKEFFDFLFNQNILGIEDNLGLWEKKIVGDQVYGAFINGFWW